MGSSKTAPVVRGSEKARTGKEALSRKPQASSAYGRNIKAIPKWTVTDYKPPRKISDNELEVRCRTLPSDCRPSPQSASPTQLTRRLIPGRLPAKCSLTSTATALGRSMRRSLA